MPREQALLVFGFADGQTASLIQILTQAWLGISSSVLDDRQRQREVPGNPESNVCNAFNPPADVPTTTISKATYLTFLKSLSLLLRSS